MRKRLAILLCLTMTLMMGVPAAAFEKMTFTAELSTNRLDQSDADQTVTLSLTAGAEIELDAIEYKVVTPWDTATVTPDALVEDYSFKGADYTSADGGCHVAWGTDDMENTTATNLGTFTITIPGGTPGGDYTIEVSDIETTRDYGDDGYAGSATAALTIVGKTVAVTGVSLDQTELALTIVDGTAGTANLTATVDPTTATDTSVKWTSSDESVATVTPIAGDPTATPAAGVNQALVEAKGSGEATITVTTTDGGKTAECKVTVTIPVKDLTLQDPAGNSSGELEMGSTLTLTPVFNPSNATNQEVTWGTSDESVATVENGVVTPVAVGGPISITARSAADTDIVATYTLTVVPVPITGISLNVTDLSLEKEETLQLEATIAPANANQAVSWSASNPEYVDVDNEGNVTAGTTVTEKPVTITATSVEDPQWSATCYVTVTPIKVKEILLPDTLTLGVNDDPYDLSQDVTVGPSNADDKSLTWSVEGTAVTVDDSGIVTAVAEGEATVTATAKDGSGVSGSCKVTVIIPVTGVNVDPVEKTILVGESTTLTAMVEPPEASNSNVTWSSDDDSIATVDEKTGEVTGVAVGKVKINATTEDGGFVNFCTVTVNPVPVNYITVTDPDGFNYSSIEHSSDITTRTVQLTAEIDPPNATYQDLQWTSDDDTIATVDNNGLVTVGQKTGSVIITATQVLPLGSTETPASESYDLTVIPIAVTGVTLDKSTAGLTVSGDSLTLTATVEPRDADNQNVDWSISDPSVAELTVSGLTATVTALAEGTATVTVTSTEDDEFYDTCEITVSPKEIPATGVTLNKENAELKVGDSLGLTATLEPPDANTGTGLTWSSSDPAVATVDGGAVTAVGGGTATITVTTEDGYSASCNVTVTVPVTGVALDQTSLTREVGELQVLTATVSPSDATNQNVTWSSSDEAVATVDGSGVVTAEGAGTATITVTTEDGGYTATCTVTVTKPDEPVTTFTITLNALGGTVSPTTLTTNAEGKVSSLPTPTNSGYTFDGWFTKESGGDAVGVATVFTADTTIYAHWSKSSGGGGGGGGNTTSHSIKIAPVENGTITTSTVSAADGNVVTITATPKAGYELDAITVTDALSKPVEVEMKDGGKATFAMPPRSVTVNATFKEKGAASPGETPASDVELPFLDVDKTDDYYDDVAGVYAKGLMFGMSDSSFGPAISTERAMIVTILYRLEGEPAVTGTAPFSDIAADQYYTNAVIWAAQTGVAAGYPDGSFQPTKTITREEMAAFFYRYAVLKGYTTAYEGNVHGYLDADSISDYAITSVNWALANGYLLDSNNYILPQSLGNRAQLAIFLNRFSDAIAATE